MKNKDNYLDPIVDDVISSYATEPVDIFGTGNFDGEYRYVTQHTPDYKRTIRDIHNRLTGNAANYRILEIGAFLGVVSIALARLGYQVIASDIKEVMSCERLRARFKRYGVECVECNLRSYNFLFGDEEFDAVIMCETLEHLNFNPLPVIKEISRVTRPSGLFYLALPNIASRGNRAKLLEGESIHNPIRHFYDQLRPNNHAAFGIHWREYTMGEIRELLQPMGFDLAEQRYVRNDTASESTLGACLRIPKRFVSRVLGLRAVRKVLLRLMLDMVVDVTMRPGLVTIARRTEKHASEFHLTDVTSPDSLP